MHYRFTIIGTTEFTYELLTRLHQKIVPVDLIVTISGAVTKKNHISGYKSLYDVALKEGIDIFEAQTYYLNDEATKEFFQNNTFDLIVCAGWQRKIPLEILNRSNYGVFGFHGSCGYLPYGRGRSPFNWSIINGDERIIQNLFKYDDSFDSPNVFSKEMFEINRYDSIKTIQYKSLIVAERQIRDLFKAYLNKKILLNTVSHDFDSWYEKRTPDSGKIDFHCKTREIYNLIRATTYPFPGAYAFMNKEKIVIWEAFPFDSYIDFSNYTPGQVVDIIDDRVIIRTVDGSIIVTHYQGASLTVGDILV